MISTFTSRVAVMLSAAVFILLPAARAQAQAPDPGLPGPLQVTTEEYDFGNRAFKPADFPTGSGNAPRSIIRRD